jgi:hypothetical protein
MQSWWQGPRETALYLYGPSAAHMAELIADVLAVFPLAQRCRVVPLDSLCVALGEAGPVFGRAEPDDPYVDHPSGDASP